MWPEVGECGSQPVAGQPPGECVEPFRPETASHARADQYVIAASVIVEPRLDELTFLGIGDEVCSVRRLRPFEQLSDEFVEGMCVGGVGDRCPRGGCRLQIREADAQCLRSPQAAKSWTVWTRSGGSGVVLLARLAAGDGAGSHRVRRTRAGPTAPSRRA